MNRWLIRFDVRAARLQYVDHRWDGDARKQYLLRPDIEWPLSVDSLVWPSVFYSEIDRRFSADSYSTIEVDPEVDGENYWLDLDRMRSYYDSHRALAPGGVFIGVELLSEKHSEAETIPYVLPGGIQAAVWLERTTPTRPPEGSTLLGYDVADAGWISGLTNCGYTPQEIAELAPVWSHRLNPFGLLATPEDAVAFRQVSDERVPEHAPFWIYALWQLPID